MDGFPLLKQNISRVYLMLEKECGNARFFLPIDNCPVDRRRPSIARQARRVQVDGAESRVVDDGLTELLAERDDDSRPSLPLAGYAGTYGDPWYGDVVVALQDGRLRLRFGSTADLVGTLEHWQHDTFIVRWDQRWLNADAFLTFALDPDGNIREARMEPVSELTDFSFDFQDLRLVPRPDDAEE